MNEPLDDRLRPEEFERLFGDEPAQPDPTADLVRGRRLRHRRRVATGAVALVALVAVGGAVGGVVRDDGRLAGPATGPSPAPSAVPTASPSPTVTSTDTAPALRRDADGNYLDRDGEKLGGSLREREPEATPFRATTRNSWDLAVRHLDPSQQHLAGYEPFAFTGGGAGSGGIQVGQKVGWTVKGDPGEGMVQLAVSRLEPGGDPRLGRDESAGLCSVDVIQEEGCRRTTVAGVEVYLGTTADGGFVMDRVQTDGEVASIIVTPLFANNTEVPLRSMGVTRAAAAELLADPELDVVG